MTHSLLGSVWYFKNYRWWGGGERPAPPPSIILQKYVRNFQIHLLFLAAGFLEDKAREKGPVNVYIFQQPIALSQTGRFQNNSDRSKKRY